MLHLAPRRLVACVLVVLALFAAACSGDSGDETADSAVSTADTATEPTPVETAAEPTAVPTAEPPADEQPAAEEPAPEEPAAAEAQPLTPTDELLYELNQISFDIETTQAEIDCMQVYFTYELAAGRTSFSVADPTLELDDQGLRDLAYAANGCVNNQSLYNWAISVTGVGGDDLTNGPVCFETWFADETWGDTVFHSFAALTFQYRIDPDAQADLINSLVDCAPVGTLTDFFVNQAEAAQDFSIAVDRQCVFDSINNEQASLEFWQALVEGLEVPVDAVAPYINACAIEVVEPTYTNLGEDFAPFSGARQLTSVEPQQRNGLYTAAPALTINPAGRYEAIIATGGGEVRITLLADIAPNTVNNFVNLANDGYYDGLTFHRVIDDFMAQGGDPNGDGSGDPGYSFADEFDNNPPLDRKGILAMANAGPDTNGSQFFITTAPTEWLNGLHTVFGVVVSGQELIDAIPARDPLVPGARAQIIDSITIVEL